MALRQPWSAPTSPASSPVVARVEGTVETWNAMPSGGGKSQAAIGISQTIQLTTLQPLTNLASACANLEATPTPSPSTPKPISSIILSFLPRLQIGTHHESFHLWIQSQFCSWSFRIHPSIPQPNPFTHSPSDKYVHTASRHAAAGVLSSHSRPTDKATRPASGVFFFSHHGSCITQLGCPDV